MTMLSNCSELHIMLQPRYTSACMSVVGLLYVCIRLYVCLLNETLHAVMRKRLVVQPPCYAEHRPYINLRAETMQLAYQIFISADKRGQWTCHIACRPTQWPSTLWLVTSRPVTRKHRQRKHVTIANQ